MAAGVYGEFLGFFPELFDDFEIYKQEPDVVSGYKLTFSREVRGVVQAADNDVDDDRYKRIPMLNVYKRYYLWTYEEISITDEFVKIEDRYYRPMTCLKFEKEGGFYESHLEMVVGDDGTKKFTPELAKGTF